MSDSPEGSNGEYEIVRNPVDVPPPAPLPSFVPPTTATNPFSIRPPTSFKLPPPPAAFKLPPKPADLARPPPMPIRRPDDEGVALVVPQPNAVNEPAPVAPPVAAAVNVPVAPPVAAAVNAPVAPHVAAAVNVPVASPPRAPTEMKPPLSVDKIASPPTLPPQPSLSQQTADIQQPTGETPSKAPEAHPHATGDEETFPSLVGWFKEAVTSSPLINKFAETAQLGVDKMIVTLDPQMKEYMDASGTIDIAVASDKEIKVGGVKEGLAHEFAHVVARGLGAPGAPHSDTLACQPVGYASGRACAIERIRLLRDSRLVDAGTAVVAVEGFVVEVTPNEWVEMPCIVLDDRRDDVQLIAYGQPINVPFAAIAHMKSHTAVDYPRASAGLAVTVGAAIGEVTGWSPQHWHYNVSGVSRRTIIENAATAIGRQYKQVLLERIQRQAEQKVASEAQTEGMN